MILQGILDNASMNTDAHNRCQTTLLQIVMPTSDLRQVYCEL